MEAESRKRGREPETTERSESDRLAKKLDVEKGEDDGCCGDGEEEVEMERGVFDFPWLKGVGEGGGVMTEEEWKATAAAEEEETFVGTLGRWCREREEVGMEGGMSLLEDNTSTSSLSLSLVELEEAWDSGGDGFWTSLLH